MSRRPLPFVRLTALVALAGALLAGGPAGARPPEPGPGAPPGAQPRAAEGQGARAVGVGPIELRPLDLVPAPLRPRELGRTCPAPPAAAAHLRLSISSTSPWTEVRIRPGHVTGRHDRAATGGATGTVLPDGFRVEVTEEPGRARRGTFETDLIVADPTAAETLEVEVATGEGGASSVQVRSATGHRPPVSVVTTRSRTLPVSRDRLYDPDFRLRRADDRQLVLAAYYPWFGATGWEHLAVAERPADPRSTWSLDGVLSMTRQARAHGVDGFAVSWMGAEKNGNAFDLAAIAALQTDGVVVPYLETAEGLDRGGSATVEQWLREAVDRVGPASLHIDGVPVVFVWDMARIGAHEWAGMRARLGRSVMLIGDADTATHGPVMGGWHAYLPPPDLTGHAERSALRTAWYRGQATLDPSVTPRAHVMTVSPGFDDRALRGEDRPVIDRAGGARYHDTWDAAVAADPDLVLVTSWNEWFEGTSIEPGTRSGDTALGATSERSGRWKAGPGC